MAEKQSKYIYTYIYTHVFINILNMGYFPSILGPVFYVLLTSGYLQAIALKCQESPSVWL